MNTEEEPADGSLSFLWEGEEWGIAESYETVKSLSVRFAHPGKPSLDELRLLRLWLPALGRLSPAEAKRHIGREDVYCAGAFGAREADNLIRHAQELGLEVVVAVQDWVSGTPVRLQDNTVFVIDDAPLSDFVYRKMKSAGRPVVEQIELD